MTVTKPRITIDLADGTDAKEGGTPTISDVLLQCDLSDLADGIGLDKKWATFEPDEWLLDGNYKLLEEGSEAAKVGIISGTISGVSDGDFATPPELTITLDGNYDLLYGITLKFSEVTGDYCDDIDIEFFDVGDVSLADLNFLPDTVDYFCELSSDLSDVRYIVFTFNSMSANNRHLRLIDIAIDSVIFKNDVLKSANIIEEISPSSIITPSNALTFSTYSEDGDFSIVNPSTIYKGLQRNQKVDVYEYVDDERIYMGRYYLKDWRSESENLASFECIDVLGILDDGIYRDTVVQYILDGELSVGQLMQQVLQNHSPAVPYNIIAALYDVDAYGWLRGGISYREHLAQLALVGGAYISCARSDGINVNLIEFAYELSVFDFTYTETDKGENSPVLQKPLVTGVEVIAHEFIDDGQGNTRVYKSTLPIGTHIVTFNEVLSDYVVTGAGSKGSEGTDWVEVLVTSPGLVTITAIKYTDAQTLFAIYNENLPSSTRTNTLRIDDVYLITPKNAQVIADRIYDYHLQRIVQDTKLFAPLSTVGDSIEISSQAGVDLTGTMERMEFDLTGGFIAKSKIVCGTAPEPSSSIKYDDRDFDIEGNCYLGTHVEAYLETTTEISGWDATPRESASFVFTGRYIKVGYLDSSPMEVFIDGVSIAVINTETSGGDTGYWLSEDISSGEHLIKVWCEGEYDITTLDYLEVSNTPFE